MLLGGAFLFQSLGYAPCKMCLWQRWPHAAAILIGSATVLVGLPFLALLGAGAALATAGIGVFHTGVEKGWWEGPNTCTSGPVGGLNPDELLNQILTAPIVRCDEVAWEWLGLSMASWNAALSLGLAAVWLTAYRMRD